MEELLQDDLLRSGVRIYLDDILIYSKDVNSHLILLERVLQKLQGLDKITVLTDRGNEFNFLDNELKKHIKTASYSPQSNGKIERKHRELGALCRLYSTTPDQNRGTLEIRIFKC
jgi:hypothetical protein